MALRKFILGGCGTTAPRLCAGVGGRAGAVEAAERWRLLRRGSRTPPCGDRYVVTPKGGNRWEGGAGRARPDSRRAPAAGRLGGADPVYSHLGGATRHAPPARNGRAAAGRPALAQDGMTVLSGGRWPGRSTPAEVARPGAGVGFYIARVVSSDWKDWRHGDAGGYMGSPRPRDCFHPFYGPKHCDGGASSTPVSKPSVVVSRCVRSFSSDCVLQTWLPTALTLAVCPSPLGIDVIVMDSTGHRTQRCHI